MSTCTVKDLQPPTD